MSYFTRFHGPSLRYALAKREAEQFREDFAPVEARRRTMAEDSNRRSAGASAMSPDEFQRRYEAHLSHVLKERAALAAAREKAQQASKPDSPPAPRKRPDPVLNPKPQPPDRQDDGSDHVIKADKPTFKPKGKFIPRQQRVRKAGGGQTLDLTTISDIAASLRKPRS